MKKIFIAITFCICLYSNNSQARTRHTGAHDGWITAQVIAAGTLVTYGVYHAYYYLSLHLAQKRLANNVAMSQILWNQLEFSYNQYNGNEHNLLTSYRHTMQSFHSLHSQARDILQRLKAIDCQTSNDIASWLNYTEALSFINRASQLRSSLSLIISKVEQFVTFLDAYNALFQLETLGQEENYHTLYPIICAVQTTTLTSAMIRQHAPQSPWPLITVWRALEQRKNAYEQHTTALTTRQFPYNQGVAPYAHATLQKALYLIDCYKKAQNSIISSHEYSHELEAETLFKIQEETARQQRLAAQAAMLKAQNDQERLIHEQQSELSKLRGELSTVKQSIANGDDSYYLYQRKRQLQDRIAQLKRALYGTQSTWSVIFNIIADED